MSSILENLITLGVCFVIILIFRYLDKNNNSMEKIKRFCQKQKDDFANNVSSMTQGLQTSAVEVQTMIDRASAAVAKLKETREVLAKEEAALSARKKEVSEFMVKIEESGQTISKLAAAAAAADKNLAKIAAESDFADSLGQKIQSAKKEMDGISSTLSQLEQRFMRENSTALAAVRDEMFSRLSGDIEDISDRLEKVRRDSETLENTAYENLQHIYNGLFDKASERADQLEEHAFEKLQAKVLARLDKYKETIESRTTEMTQTVKEKLTESNQLLRNFKSEWTGQASAMLRESKETMESMFSEQSEAQTSELARMQAATAELSEKLAVTISESERRLAELEEKLSGFEGTASYELSKLGGIISEVPAIDSRLRLSLENLEKKSDAAFDLFTQDQNAHRESFEATFNAKADALFGKIQNLEDALAELKNQAYINVSEKMKIFEDDFMKDLQNRSAALTTEMENWQTNIEGRLEALSAQNEAQRSNAENEYTEKLTARISALSETSRAQTDELEKRMTDIEADLRERITGSTEAIQAFSEQYRAEFQQAKTDADAFARNELQNHSIELQEALRRQRQDLETRCKEMAEVIETARGDSEALVNGIRDSIFDWERKNERMIESASENINAKIEEFKASAVTMITNAEADSREDISDAVRRIGRDTAGLQNSVEELRGRIQSVSSDLDEKTRAAIERFEGTFSALSKQVEEQTEAAKREAEDAAAAYKAAVLESNASLEETRQRVFRKIQNDTDAITSTLDEINSKQKSFIEQTRIFSRADELKTGLEADIEKLKIEVAGFSVYQDTMARIESNYKQIQRLEEEAGQKLNAMTASKKLIDTLNKDFTRLLSLSSEIDERMASFIRVNTDMQNYQTRIRNFEDSMTEMNARYERLSKKSPLLDQTLNDIDKAFDLLQKLESGLHTYREESAGVPETITALRRRMDSLATMSERTDEIGSKMIQIDSELSEVDKRSQEIHRIMTESEQKLRDMTDARAQIDAMGKDFTRLLELSSVIDERMENFSRVNADILDYQARIKHFESSMGEINARYAQLDQKSPVLDQTLNDIDKAFDQLKTLESGLHTYREAAEGLPDDILTLRKQVDSLAGMTARTEEIESRVIQIGAELSEVDKRSRQIHQIAEESEQKLDTMFSGKRQIDDMEADFNKLLGISSKINDRISNLTLINDDVQNYQAKIRDFSDSINEVNARYERLDKKFPVLERTITDIDKAFDQLKQLEESLRISREKTASLPDDIDTLRQKVEELAEISERAGSVESKVTQLEAELSDVEKRNKKLQNERENFSNLEKNLRALKKDVDKEIGLFRALAKEKPVGAGSSKKWDSHAPSVGDQEHIKELAHKGWTPEEISNTLKYPVSVIEMVLTMSE